MHVTVERRYLLSALRLLRPVVPSHGDVIGYRNILLTPVYDDQAQAHAPEGARFAPNGFLRIMGGDARTTLITYIPTTIEALGEVCVPFETLSGYIQATAVAPVVLTDRQPEDDPHAVAFLRPTGDGYEAREQLVGGYRLVVETGKSEATIMCVNPRDYPALRLPKEGRPNVALSCDQVTHACDLLLPCVGRDADPESPLRGILVDASETERQRDEGGMGEVTLAAVGGKGGARVALARMEQQVPVPLAPFSALLPWQTFEVLASLCRNDPGIVRVTSLDSAGRVQWETDHGTLISGVLAARFPNYHAVETLATYDQPVTAVLAGDALLRACEMLIVAGTGCVQMDLRSDEGDVGLFGAEVFLRAVDLRGTEVRGFQTRVAAEVRGAAASVKLNPAFLRDVAAWAGERPLAITLDSVDAKRPVRVALDGRADYTVIIAPMATGLKAADHGKAAGQGKAEVV